VTCSLIFYCSLGHGCGHNLICISGIATAMAVKAALESGKASGKVVLFGTPSEGNVNKC
jgi:metal-dependent amidase/aminoacylase/carboxypeptidase family protein